LIFTVTLIFCPGLSPVMVALVPLPSVDFDVDFGAGAIFTVVGSDFATAVAADAAAVVFVAIFAACVAALTFAAAV
jgi:hypothetical protein